MARPPTIMARPPTESADFAATPDRIVSPLEALASVTQRIKARRTVTVEVEAAAGSWLAETVQTTHSARALAGDPPATRRASLGGFAVGAGVRLGVEAELLDQPGLGEDVWAWRVREGEVLPASVAGVLHPTGVLQLGSDRIRRLESSPLADRPAGLDGDDPVQIAAGTRLDSRSVACLAASGHRELRSWALPRIGLLDASPEGGAGCTSTLSWLRAELAPQVAQLVDSGRAATPDGFRRALLRAQQREVELLVTVGGIGRGVDERLRESILDARGQLYVEGLAAANLESLVFAKVGGLDLIGLPSLPLGAAAAWDLFLRPAIQARSGAPPATLGWPRYLLPHRSPGPPGPGAGTAPWQISPARLLTDPEAGDLVEPLPWPGPWIPWVPGASGWAVRQTEGPRAAWFASCCGCR